MKQLIRLSLCVLLSLFAVSARAQLSFTVSANPEHFDKITYGYGTSAQELAFSPDGEQNTFSDTPTGYAYLKCYPKANVTYTVYIYDASDNLVVTWSDLTEAVQKFTQRANINGGRMVVESTMEVGTPTITVTVNGDASKVYMDLRGTQVTTLTSGQNEIELTTPYVNFRSTEKGHKFYRLTCNDMEKAGSYDHESGYYNYSYTSTKRGDKFVIDVDYPEGPWNINILANDADFVQHVFVNDAEQTDWKNGLSVKGGSVVRVEGDKFNYVVGSTVINGVATEVPSASVEKIIDGDMDISFDVTKIERDKSFVFYFNNKCTASIITKNHAVFDVKTGYNIVPFGDIENPLEIVGQTTSQNTSESFEVYNYLYVNDELVKTIFSSAPLTVGDGDVVKMFYVEGTKSNLPQEPSRLDVEITLDGFRSGVLPVVKTDYIKEVSLLAREALTVLPGTVVTIEESDIISKVEVNGNTVSPSDGLYTITVTANTTVNITEDTTVGIKATKTSNKNEIYTITGVKMTRTPANGLYIVNGKMMLRID